MNTGRHQKIYASFVIVFPVDNSAARLDRASEIGMVTAVPPRWIDCDDRTIACKVDLLHAEEDPPDQLRNTAPGTTERARTLWSARNGSVDSCTALVNPCQSPSVR
jgi:hypothetical protein